MIVRLKATGNAPILKQQVFKISANSLFEKVVLYIRKELGLNKGEGLYVYVNSAFCPCLDEPIGNLVDCFGTQGQLVVNYALVMAWG